MLSWLVALLTAALAPASPTPQGRADSPPPETFYAVSYVETPSASVKAAITALQQYRSGSRAQDGFQGADIFEQIGRPGHFAIIETWRDQKAFDARDPAVQKQLLGLLQPIRVSGYDQRPYKVLTTAPRTASTDGRAVYVIAHVDVSPSPEVPPLLRRLADASRQEAGNLRFDVVQHTMRANHFTVIEGWRNEQALDAHVAAAHTRQYRDQLQPFTGSPLDERVYRAVD